MLPATDVDTDQIIPARFLFHDWRFAADGRENPAFILNRPEARHCTVLVAGRNFGCGSSREHAPWALVDYGIRAVISTEIADIFRSNALKNGLLPIVLDEDAHRWLLDNPGAHVDIDVESSSVKLPNGTKATYSIDDFARYCLLNGIDQLGFLQQHEADISAYEENRPWKP